MWIQVLLSVQFFWAAESQQTGPLSFCLTFRLYQDYDTTVTELNEDSVKKISVLLLPNDIFYRTFLGHTFCISATPLILWSLLLKFRPAIIETVVGWWEDPIYMTVWSCFYLIIIFLLLLLCQFLFHNHSHAGHQLVPTYIYISLINSNHVHLVVICITIVLLRLLCGR